MFRKILVCLDGSPFAEKIISTLTSELVLMKSEFVFLCVTSLPETIIPIGVPGAPVIPAITAGNIQRTVKEEQESTIYLEKLSRPLILLGWKIENVVLPGNTGETIVRYAEDNGCSAIMMASHGHGGFRRFTLGSTTEFVMHHTKLPLIIMR